MNPSTPQTGSFQLQGRERHSARYPWLILAVSVALTIGAATFVWRLRDTVMQVRFENAIEAATDRITGRLEIYAMILRGGAGLFASNAPVTAQEFHRFAQRIEVQERLPGIQGVGWTERVEYTPDQHPDERQAIRYLEPLDERNRAAIGYDMYSDSTRREAMAKARDLGTAVMSGGVTLVQEIAGPRQAGFLLYVPVYDGPELIPQAVEDRRRRLRGFVYAPFRADDLFAGIFGTEREPRVSFAVYDGTRIDPGRLLHQSPTMRPNRGPTRAVQLEIAGRSWTVQFRSERALEQGVAANVFRIVLVGGILMTIVIAWLAFAQARARAAAETANRAKSEFLAVMSHELRTPLNAIGGYVELMELGIHGPVTAEQLRALGRVRRAKDHLLGLINNLLNYARLEAGRVEINTEPVNVESMLDIVSDMIAPQAESRQLTFEHVRGSPDVFADTDRDKAQQVLLNLLSNAVKFTPEGGTITVSWTHSAYDIDISVRDTGIGIAPDKLQVIFDPFVQVDADLTRDRAGSGLGLAIARDLSRAMGGDVTATSTPGRGSTFVLRLPRAARPASA